MFGDLIRADLRQALPGDRNFVRTTEGRFVHRSHPEHLALIRSTRASIRVREDLENFRRMLTLTANVSTFG